MAFVIIRDLTLSKLKQKSKTPFVLLFSFVNLLKDKSKFCRETKPWNASGCIREILFFDKSSFCSCNNPSNDLELQSKSLYTNPKFFKSSKSYLKFESWLLLKLNSSTTGKLPNALDEISLILFCWKWQKYCNYNHLHFTKQFTFWYDL